VDINAYEKIMEQLEKRTNVVSGKNFTMTHRKGKERNEMEQTKYWFACKKTKECLKRSTRANIYFVLRGWRTFPIVSFLFVPNI